MFIMFLSNTRSHLQLDMASSNSCTSISQMEDVDISSIPWEDLRDYAKERGYTAESLSLLEDKLSSMPDEEIMSRTYHLYSDTEQAKEKMRPIVRKKKKRRGRSSGSGKVQYVPSCVEKDTSICLCSYLMHDIIYQYRFEDESRY